MYRNLYDTDCITWSPQGRIFQVEYAMEAVKQGTCCVGLRSDTHVVLCSLKRSVSKFAGHHQKLFKIDDHVGVAMSGITADAKVISNFMRNECFHHKYVYDAPIPVGRLVLMVADKSQANTQRSGKRPFGVGLLAAGFDDAGPHLFETCPSGNYFESYAMAFGARSQSSKTYLERNFESFPGLSPEELELHAMKALNASLAADAELTADTVSMAIVGKNQPWKELSLDEIQALLDKMNVEPSGEDVQM
ncbi:Proteasome subunit alpha type,related [Neospora caninum Liverpool]|uniref:Proteasome subunit alpha type, related n=1 Tax=Neospora caninum (strain Liverpool) TaxID=572307 RepID=F0VRM6_NEOCL|nr:Proteasome subunit alpha type,related [Neospora caninum Liverpool]CBZ56374.1 Proteasome subunit alpha type,related [Neospora caninum Liverpool]CEL71134.1 TPA: Proteasome subunit alpha type, related [Neospora caninum Liverpool]|eukprot:XP_003886399.1 Proteasome subunit alpha type,related [Neospora caninum Liverpool]